MHPSFGPSLSAEPLPWIFNRLLVIVPELQIFLRKISGLGGSSVWKTK